MTKKFKVDLDNLIKQKELAENRKITLKQIELETGISYLTLNKLRKPEPRGCQTSTLEALCTYFGKGIQEVLVEVPETSNT